MIGVQRPGVLCRAAPNVCVFVALGAIALMLPLPALVVSGMEHVFHVLLMVLFVVRVARLLADGGSRYSAATCAVLLALASCLVLVRFESLFVICAACALLLVGGRWKLSLAMGLAAVAPAVAYGAISASHGWFWLPNSLMMKSQIPVVASLRGIIWLLGGSACRQLVSAPHMLSLTFAGIVLYIVRFDERKGAWEKGQVMLLVFVAGTLLHLQFARTGWFYRYEAYLVGVGLLVFSLLGLELIPRLAAFAASRKTMPKAVAVLALTLFLLVPLAQRGFNAAMEAPQAMNDRYLEHIQQARFLARYYSGSTILVNDIGAIAYHTDCRLLDMAGLASREPAQFMRQTGGYTKARVLEWAESTRAEIAILTVQWQVIAKRIPDEWTLVGEWDTPRNVLFPKHTRICFYAVRPGAARKLAASLRDFMSTLPREIAQRGTYAEPAPPGRS